MYPVISFRLFGYPAVFHLAGIFYALAFLAGVLVWSWLAKKERLEYKKVWDYAFGGVIFGLVGARLFYILEFRYQFADLWEMAAIWNGGLVFYGGFYFCRRLFSHSFVFQPKSQDLALVRHGHDRRFGRPRRRPDFLLFKRRQFWPAQ